jgi:ABC-type lipoprotein export system ATPase subunit
MILELNQVSKTYRKETGKIFALKNINLKISAGDFFAVQGPSGSGKTTLLLTASGLQRPDNGHVRLEGESLYEMHSEARARIRAKKIGYVFQQYHLIPYLTVLENVMIPNLAAPVKHLQERARQLIDELGLTGRATHIPAELSAGEKQRTALARALIQQPRILFADEITGNLDKTNTEIVLDYLKKFTSQGGAVLLVTHNQKAAQSAQIIFNLTAGNLEKVDRTPPMNEETAG